MLEEDDRTVTQHPLPEDETLDVTLRPQNLDEFVGQDKLKKNLKVFIQAAQKRKEPLDHCLFSAPPGLGKTTLAHIIAQGTGPGVVEVRDVIHLGGRDGAGAEGVASETFGLG
jgi:Holliday junction DNA helicase RuvB